MNDDYEFNGEMSDLKNLSKEKLIEKILEQRKILIMRDRDIEELRHKLNTKVSCEG